MSDATKREAWLEAVIRPIVEGQIRGFLKEHPKLVGAVDWYKPRKDKATTFTNSLAKRIVRDLTCATTSARLEAAITGTSAGTPSNSAVASPTAAKPGRMALVLCAPVHRAIALSASILALALAGWWLVRNFGPVIG